MGGPGKHSPAATVAGDLKALFPITTRRTKVFAYGFFIVFIACTAFLAFSPSGNAGSPWYNSLFTSSSISTSIAPYRSQFSSLVSFFFPNSSSPGSQIPPHNLNESLVGSQKDRFWGDGLPGIGAPAKNQTVNVLNSGKNGVLAKNQSNSGVGLQGSKNQTTEVMGSLKNGVLTKNQEKKSSGLQENVVVAMNQTSKGLDPLKGGVLGKNQPKEVTGSEKVLGSDVKNQTGRVKNQTDPAAVSPKNGDLKKNQTAQGPSQDLKKSKSAAPVQVSVNGGQKRDVSIDKMMNCDIFQGKWVRDDSYPLYPEGSCPHIDEPFDCYRNGRQDRAYQKLRWQPNGCNIPRLNGSDMLERLRGKRLVFVGDSLNRNMWESLVCVLRNSLKDKKKVFEASGRHQFRTEGSYSFLFKDYGCTVEFFRSPFLVQEWEMPDHNGSKKETLRLDIVERSASKYKDAYAIIFNTGHWWTHEKTSQGKDYYQEGNHVYSELNAAEAFHKALNTWARWVDSNVNPKKSHVFFRGYSASHFSGGQWNSGGQCDRETEPIKNEKYLSSYPPKMSILEEVIKGMKTHVSYMNITRMTDYRKDAHPSIYRKPNMTEEEKSPDQIQDCSHWCLPGVPDSWNELLYAQLLIKQHQKEH